MGEGLKLDQDGRGTKIGSRMKKESKIGSRETETYSPVKSDLKSSGMSIRTIGG